MVESSTIPDNVKYLFEPIQFGDHALKNRFIMASMTCFRADPDTRIAGELHYDFYTQRAPYPAVINLEGLSVGYEGRGYKGAAAMETDDQISAWKKIIDEIIKLGAFVTCQIYHPGRQANAEQLKGTKAIAPSVVKNRFKYFIDSDEPIEMSKKMIEELKACFVRKANLAISLGCNAVEIHGANGHIVDQFLRDSTNLRNDEYGGSIENRCRFLLEITDDLIKEIGCKKVGIKLSVCGRDGDMYDSNPKAILDYLLPELNKRNILYVTVTRPPDGYDEFLAPMTGEEQIPNIYDGLKKSLPDVLLVGNTDFDAEEASSCIKNGIVDLVAFGRNFISNPDYTERVKNGWPINELKKELLFTPGKKGYTDYEKFIITNKTDS